MHLTISQIKRAIWFVLIPITIVGGIVILQYISNLYSYFQQARVIESALHVTESQRIDAGYLNWLPEDPGPRELELLTKETIAKHYLLAFEELTYSLLTNDSTGLKSYFHAGALDDVLLVTSTPIRSQFVDWDHKIKANFYAPDGASIAFTDTYQYAQGTLQENDLLDIRIAQRKIDTVMMLDDGNWRIHHWKVIEDQVINYPEINFVGLPEAFSTIRGINYIARSAPFNLLWSEFDPAEIDEDFETIFQLGFNTLRFFIAYPPPIEVKENLPILLDTAEKYQLKVIPTLLDTYTRYRLEDLPSVQNYLEDLSTQLTHPAVLAIDVKNEADSDFETAGHNKSRTFLSYVLAFTRHLTNKPVLVGLIKADEFIAQHADAISLHHYGPAEDLLARIQEAKLLKRPILLEEFGFHSWLFKYPDPHSEAEQAWYYQQVLTTTQNNGVGWMAWTLYDLPHGAMPGGREVERHLGILNSEGHPKPVVEVIKGTTVEKPSLLAKLSNYYLVIIAVGLILVAVVIFFLLRKHLKRKNL